MRPSSVIVLLVSLLALIAAMWIANQGGLVAQPVIDDSGRPIHMSAGQAFVGTVWPLIHALPWVAVMWLAAVGFGRLIRKGIGNGGPQSAIIIGGGFAVLLIVDWLIATAGLMSSLAWVICSVGVLPLVGPLLRELRATPAQRVQLGDVSWGVVLAMPALGALLVACSLPPSTLWAVEALGYDVLSYHLQLPTEWLGSGAMRGLEHNVYSFLPNLVEAGYMHSGALRGSVYDAIYATQLLHASVAIAAATQLALLVRRHAGPFAACVAGAAFLATPWTIITGSLAYDEMFAMLFGVCALRVAVETREHNWRSAACIGALIGAATMAKLTAGFMLGLPILIIAEWPMVKSEASRDGAARLTRRMGIAFLSAIIFISPYLVRNAAQTGNPIFPFAAETLGKAHWTQAQVTRWNEAHDHDGSWRDPIRALGYQWLCNTGYGAVLGSARQRETAAVEATNVARFHREWGVPTLWLFAAGGMVVALCQRATGRTGAAMLSMLIIQLMFWLTETHLQSRFLIFTLLPGCWFAAMAIDALCRHHRMRLAGLVAGTALIAALTVVSFDVLFHQVASGQAPWYWADSLTDKSVARSSDPDDATIGDHPINRVAPTGHTLIIADNARLAYIDAPITYHSAFDRNPLGEMIRAIGTDPRAITSALTQAGFTHVWINWGELHRLTATYGFDADVTPGMLQSMIDTGWRLVAEPRPSTQLYELPATTVHASPQR